MSLVLLVVAIVLFVLAAFVPITGNTVRVNLVALGLAFFAAAHLAI
jgi:hypothetical protein